MSYSGAYDNTPFIYLALLNDSEQRVSITALTRQLRKKMNSSPGRGCTGCPNLYHSRHTFYGLLISSASPPVRLQYPPTDFQDWFINLFMALALY